MTPTPIPPQAATIDTLISSISMFATVLLAVIGSIGAFLVWNGFVLRARAEKDLDRIEETARKSEKIFADYKQRTDEAFIAADELMSTLINEASKAKEHGKRVEATAEEAQQDWEKIKTVYSNVSQGTQISFSQPTFYQPNGYPFNPAVYANPIAQPPITQDVQGRGRIVNLGTEGASKEDKK